MYESRQVWKFGRVILVLKIRRRSRRMPAGLQLAAGSPGGISVAASFLSLAKDSALK